MISLDNDTLHLAYLFQSGYTHHDLKLFFLEDDTYSPESLWKATIDKSVSSHIPQDRQEKISTKAIILDIITLRETLEQKNISIITQKNPLYPDRLKQVGHAPYFFYVRGTLRESLPLLIGVVGSRKHTPYAKRILERVLPDVISHGIGIVSGGATGVDSLGHMLALEHSGYTIAVFGTGIDRCYPANHKQLYEDILAGGGALISHFPLGTGPEIYNFPMRNEIVAGLSSGILIPEAGLGSGTLITAQLALEHGRDVFAIPGDIDRLSSEGTNMLIATGQAKCVRSSADILEEYFELTGVGSGMTPIIREVPKFETKEAEMVYEAIQDGKNTIDTLMNQTELSLSDIVSHVALLEIQGYIELDTFGRYKINP